MESERERLFLEREQAGAALRASEERLRLITETIGEVFWMADVDLAHMFYVSPAYERIWGRTPESLYQNPRSFIDAIHPEDRGRVLAELVPEESAPPFDIEFRIIRSDGSIRWIWDRGFPVHEPGGQVSCYVGVAQDITERKHAEEALNLHGTIVDTMSEGVCLVRASDAAIIYANPRFEAIFGYGPGELNGKPVTTLNASDERSAEAVAEEILQALRNNGVWRGEVRNRKKDGTLFWCQASVSTFQHSQHGDVGVSVLTDITERKREQAHLLQANTFLDSIVENIPDMVFVKDAKNLRFVLFNRAGEELLGYTRPELIGKNDYDFFPKEEADFFTEKDRTTLRDKILLDIPEELIKTAQHGERLLHTKKIPILDDKGEPAYLLGISEDITDQKHAEQMQRRLFEQVRAGRERLAVLSRRLMEVQEVERRHLARELHDEIGQYLTGINLLLDPVKHLPPEGAVERLDEVRALVDGLIARVRDVSLDLRPAMLDDFGVLPALSWLFGRYTAQTGITVAFKHRALQQRFTAEQETAVYRIVQEALTNVARHAGVDSVNVEAWADGGVLGVSISDQGAGFDVDAVLANGTTGGLSGLRERAMLLGGRLTIESKPGVGTRLIVEFPAEGQHNERAAR